MADMQELLTVTNEQLLLTENSDVIIFGIFRTVTFFFVSHSPCEFHCIYSLYRSPDMKNNIHVSCSRRDMIWEVGFTQSRMRLWLNWSNKPSDVSFCWTFIWVLAALCHRLINACVLTKPEQKPDMSTDFQSLSLSLRLLNVWAYTDKLVRLSLLLLLHCCCLYRAHILWLSNEGKG